jgi:signal transduction histidine kinase/lipopolysaccharide biosynthesis regulator YciM
MENNHIFVNRRLQKMIGLFIYHWFVFLSLLSASDQKPPGIADLRSRYSEEKGMARIETGLQICDSLLSKPDELLRFSQSLLKEAMALVPNTPLLTKVYRSVSDGYFYTDSLQKSNEYLLKAIILAESFNPMDTVFLGGAYNDLGLNLQDLGKRAEARVHLVRAIQLCEACSDKASLADAKSNLASLSYSEGKLEESVTLFKEAYQIDLETGNIKRQSSSLNNLGRIYVDWGKYDTGLEYYFRSVALIDSVNDRKTMAIRYNNIGMLYQLMKKHRDAIRWIEKARVIDEAEGMVLRLGTRYFNLATSHTALGNYSIAKRYFEKADSFYSAIGQTVALSKVNAGLGQLYFNQGDREQALRYFQKSLRLADSAGSLPEQSNSYQHLYHFYKNAGQYDQALYYFEKFSQSEDSIFNLKVSKQIEEMEVEHQTARKEAEISRLESENRLRNEEISFRKKERNWAFAGLIILGLFLVALYRFYTTVKRQKTELAVQNETLERLNHTLNRLFSIISHDLRNATAAYQSSARIIAHYFDKGEPEKIKPVVPEISKNAAHLSSMLETLLQWSVMQIKGVEPEKRVISIKQEAEKVVSLYKESAQAKSDTIIVSLSDEKAWCDPESFQLILRNLVNNAIKYTSGGKITISGWSEDGHTTLQVSDTGTGIPAEMLADLFSSGKMETRRGTSGEKGTGLGLQLVSEHIRQNGGAIEVKSDQNKGTQFIITLPAREI